MKNIRFLSSLIFSLFFCGLIFAQNSNEETKTKQQKSGILIDQILAETPNLKLGENRVIVYARAGNIVWKTDQKKARALFQTAAGELINAQAQTEADSKLTNYENRITSLFQLRSQILYTVSENDAELALELLKKSLEKGLSASTLDLLKKLNAKDAETAAAVASQIIEKLIKENFMSANQPNLENIGAAVTLLRDYLRDKQPDDKGLRYNDAQIKNLAETLIAFYVKYSAEYNNLSLDSILGIADKFAPASAAAIRKQRNYPALNSRADYESEFTKLANGEVSGEQIAANAKNFSPDYRKQLLDLAVVKLAEQGDINRVTEILKDNFEDDALGEAARYPNSIYLFKLMSGEKFAEAENFIDGLPDSERFSSLISLAEHLYQKDPAENKSRAVAVLEKALALLPGKPEDSQQLNSLMQIISSFGKIEPAEAFRLYESVIPQLNEISEATAFLSNFQGGGKVRQNEFLLSERNSFGFYDDDRSILQTISQADFERTLNLINLFARNEIRLSLKLQAAESLLN